LSTSDVARRIQASEVRAAQAEAAAQSLRNDMTAATQGEAQWKQRFSEERSLRQKLATKITELQGNIRVVCRVRPLNAREDSNGVQAIDSESVLIDGVSHRFDAVLGDDSTQDQVGPQLRPLSFESSRAGALFDRSLPRFSRP
jgi:hypothetical protein